MNISLRSEIKQGLKQFVLVSLCSILTGLVVGVITAIFGRGLLWIGAFRSAHFYILIPFLALAGLAIVYAYQHWAGEASKGMGLVFDMGHGRADKIPLRLIPLVTATTWLTHLFGGSAGREGVAVQIGATVGHAMSRFVDFPNKSRLFLVMGMAAGFGGLFQTPFAAVLFALEVLIVGSLQIEALWAATLAGLISSQTSHALGLEKFTFPVTVDLSLDMFTTLKLAGLGICFGLAGHLFAWLLHWGKGRVAVLVPNPYKRIFVGGIALSLLLILLQQGRYSGLGTNLIEASLAGQSIFTYDWLLKIFLTVLTLSLGFQGGEVTPLFAIGASLGAILAVWFGLPVALVAALGYACVFGSATNTFLAPILIGGEVFGYANIPYFFVAMAFAYLVKPKTSIYSGQEKRTVPIIPSCFPKK
ncbi:chloride channel protein [Streptococcus caprae]|uniref:Chloride channel protein n=1 Tax=Streptococcus caprae TaxID=1640501 RepID=A0ABV8CZF6_9STRE